MEDPASPAVSLAWIVALPFIAAAILFTLPNYARNLAAGVAGAFTLLALGLLLAFTPDVFAGLVPAVAWPWLPLAGADLGFRADGLAFMFAGLVLGIGALVVLYARYYLSSADPMARFFAFFMLFMGAMLGIVLADNLILLVIFWELTSLSSFLLIGYWQHRSDARQGARMALVITGTGGLALLAGVLLIGQTVGSYKLDVVLQSATVLQSSSVYLPALLLVLAGAFTKSAQVPFHFWLPQAMAAPTPVSAYLHSATMVKAGIFLIARLHPTLAGTDPWFYIVTSVGLATLVVGAYIAVFQHDLKGLLAYSTISHLGLITLLFGLDTRLASIAAVFHILNHATFKASLFMAAGIIDHESGSRDMRALNGLWKYMPITAVLAIVASAAMAGVPLLNGFLSKEMFFAETIGLDSFGVFSVLVPVLATVAAGFSVAYSMRFIHDVFWNGEPIGLPRKPHDPPFWMLVPVGVLAGLCLFVGLFPAVAIGPLLEVAAASVIGGELPYYSLKIWHGFNLPLIMSVLALALGAAFYLSLQRLFRLHDHVHIVYGGRQIFDSILRALLNGSRAVIRWLATGRLHRSMALIVAVTITVAVAPWLTPRAANAASLTLAINVPPLLATVLWAVGLAATLGLLWLHRDRFTAVLLLGGIGLIVSITFALLSAPDLALTQLLVEIASVVLLILALNYLPARADPLPANSSRRWRDGLLAAAAGICVTVAVAVVLTGPSVSAVAPWLLANSVPGAAGTNAVNVIIVDFRALDTLGEIAVLGIAALIIVGVLQDYRPRRSSISAEKLAAAGQGFSLMLSMTSRALVPAAAVVAIWFFLRGHNLPGGGFIAGLVLALGLLLPYLARGTSWVEERQRINYEAWIGWGLFIAGLTGVVSLALGYPFLTSTYLTPEVPIIGKIPIASALFFDIGVFATVTGAVTLALTRLGRVNVGPR